MRWTKDEVIAKIIARLRKMKVYGVKPSWFSRYRSNYLYGWYLGVCAWRIPPRLVAMLEEHGVSLRNVFRRREAYR